ncbi:hypothetical protein C9374_002366 [Naegleria lovaniensis]|uniref:G-protein coupled receptors family 1 profile domain-containing protein n=1 Tax=Naegleria lovaniensis TaxID=51637 RepID=A0AA88KQN4_NAELO|nr:uncharacterized protein C9374_002366 [Naegleria lovaniensis]KAG2386622.1 hypothetical protein C9374_002366 [Naegleria lovaniensis]
MVTQDSMSEKYGKLWINLSSQLMLNTIPQIVNNNDSQSWNETAVVSVEQHVLRYVTGSSAIISILGSLFIIFSTILFKIVSCKKRNRKSRTRYGEDFSLSTMNHRLVLYLSISDLFASLSYAISLFGISLEYEWCCTLQGFLMTCFEVSSVLWSTCICLQLFLSVTPHFSEERHKRRKILLEIAFHIICWIFPLVYTIVVLFTDQFNRVDNLQQWCWIGLHHDRSPFLNFRFFTFLLVYICVVLCAVFFLGLCICFRMHRRKKSNYEILSLDDQYQHLGKKTIINFVLILLAFVITWIPAFINRLIESIVVAQTTSASMISGIFWLDLVQAITNPLQGFLNMIFYGHHFFGKYRLFFCPRKKNMKKAASKTSLLSADSGNNDYQNRHRQISPDRDKNHLNVETLDEIKFGVIYTEGTIKADSPTAEHSHLVPKSVYYYHMDAPYEVEEDSDEEDRAHFNTGYGNMGPTLLVPNYFTSGAVGDQPLYASYASSGGNADNGLRIIAQQDTPNSAGVDHYTFSTLGQSNHDSLQDSQQHIRFMPHGFSAGHNGSVIDEYHNRLDEFLD